ncbi:MFS general substrate transporter [Sporormia fimetaria CBS 119925]|uniref:MFS general substrate transporter n=1 Tax=Sporormia fimetaria CBS 119925 TaxID=1340428 RepID=A0A6A6VGN3_9PLEO|nr:MFS general substrate transporter [Sporormia fimetaria CBS 119925]
MHSRPYSGALSSSYIDSDSKPEVLDDPIQPPAASTSSREQANSLSSALSTCKHSLHDDVSIPPSKLSSHNEVNNTISARPNLSTLLCFGALTLSIFLVALDTVLIPTALPTISLSFHIPDSLYAWTGSAYLLANAASVPLWGKLSDIFGRKPVILVANSIFLGGSILCAVSTSAVMLVAGRAVQGLGGGGVVVLAQVCVSDLFSIRDRSFYLGIIGAVWAVASALGPVLGGIFAEKLHWRWCFYINLPIVSLSTVLLFFTLHLHNPRTPFLPGLLSIDWLGTFTILTGTLLFLIGLQLGSESAYSAHLVIWFLIFGSTFLLLFPLTQHLTEKRYGSPLLPLRIFRDLSNLSALGVCACDALVFNSVAYFLPLYFQLILAVSPSMTGVYMLAIAIPLAVTSLLSGYIIERTGRCIEILQLGLGTMTLGIGLLVSLSTSRDLGKIIAFLVIVGIGFGPNFHAPLIALQSRMSGADTAAGTSAFGFVRMVSGAIGVVGGQVVFRALMRGRLGEFMEMGVERGFAERLSGGEVIAEAGGVERFEEGLKGVVRGGMVGSLRGVWVLCVVVAGVGLGVSFGVKRTRLRKSGEGERKAGSAAELVEG